MSQTLKQQSDVNLNFNKIHKMKLTLDSKKTHVYDGICIRILKLCSLSIVKPPSLILRNCLNSGTSSGDW